jgi:hypothetical protein
VLIRPITVTLVAVAALAAVAVAVVVHRLPAISRPELRTAAAPAGPAPAGPAPSAGSGGELTVASVDEGTSKHEARASGPSKYTDTKALTYFRNAWQDATTKRISDIRTAGRYLRIYTNLPESADNSKTALALCERGLKYLAEIGEDNPVVFVQAKFGENGNPVLANILGPDDKDCRVTHPDPA